MSKWTESEREEDAVVDVAAVAVAVAVISEWVEYTDSEREEGNKEVGLGEMTLTFLEGVKVDLEASHSSPP